MSIWNQHLIFWIENIQISYISISCNSIAIGHISFWFQHFEWKTSTYPIFPFVFNIFKREHQNLIYLHLFSYQIQLYLHSISTFALANNKNGYISIWFKYSLLKITKSATFPLDIHIFTRKYQNQVYLNLFSTFSIENITIS